MRRRIPIDVVALGSPHFSIEEFKLLATMVAGRKKHSGVRFLITSSRGELLMVDATADRFELVSRLRVFDEETEVLSHPALVGKRLYIRDSTSAVCVDLE